jgi:predicted ATPase/DNA-binding SARP family transcriptional activator
MDGGPAVQLLLLGPLVARGSQGEATIREGLPRRLLAALALQAGTPQAADVLIEALWPDRPPNDARNALQVLVSYLRKQLGPLAPGLAVERGPGGYRLLLDDPRAMDVVRFDEGVRSVPEQLDGLTADDLAGHLARLEATLALWRGAPYVDVAYEDFAQAEITRLGEQHARAEDRRAGLLLALGRPGDAAGLLQQHVAEHPLHESSWALLMVGLYRSGRQADALRAYTTVREHLVAQLGLEPGAELRKLEQQILDQDPALDWRPPPSSASPAAPSAPTGPAPVTLAPVAPLASRVPQPLSPLVGRLFEINEVRSLLGDRRLVTLVGPAGVGKTRLALEVARLLADAPADAAVGPTVHGGHGGRTVLFVELGSLHDPAGVPPLLAAEVDVPAVPGRDPLEAVASRLAAHPAVLVLDTCEHLLDAVARAAALLLRRIPELRLLATSRQALGIEGEVAWTVPALELADDGAASVIDVEPSGAVRLFVERARAVRPDFALTDDNAADVARICRVLDGLPLAITLAAARVNLLSPAGIVERLDDRFKLLSRGGRDAEARQRSLRSAVEWSYDLLGPSEQRLFCRLGVFSGSFDLDAVTAVTAVTAHDIEGDVFEQLGDLVDRSLVVAGTDDRFVLLDTLRAFALDELERAGPGDAEALRARHAAWYTAIALAADPKSHGPLPGRSGRLRAEWPNIRAALTWLFATGHAADGARLAGAVAGFLVLDGRLVQAERWLQLGLAADDDAADAADDATLASVHRGLGILELYQGRFPESHAACTTSVELARRTGDDELVASTLLALGAADWGIGDHPAALAHHGEAALLFERAGDERGLGFALARMGRTMLTTGDPGAVEHLERAERLLAAARAEWMHSVALEHLAAALVGTGRLDEALAHARRAFAVAEDVGSHAGAITALLTVGRVLLARGEPAEAHQVHRAALSRALGMANPGAIADAVDALAREAETGDPATGAELLGCAAAVRDDHGVSMAPSAETGHAALVDRYRERLGAERFAALERAGRAHSPTWALDALDALGP